MVDITIVNGVYKPTYNYGAPPCTRQNLEILVETEERRRKDRATMSRISFIGRQAPKKSTRLCTYCHNTVGPLPTAVTVGFQSLGNGASQMQTHQNRGRPWNPGILNVGLQSCVFIGSFLTICCADPFHS